MHKSAAKRWLATRFNEGVEMTDVDRLVDLLDVLLTNPQNGDVLKYNGTKWVNGNSGSVPDNWCIAVTSNPSVNPLTPAADTARILTLTIESQSGSDFSVGEYPIPGRPAILSASGGRFQMAIFVSQPVMTTLDPSSDEPRFLYVPAQCGDTGLSPNTLSGIDITLPFLRGNWGYGSMFAGVPGVASPGGPVFHSLTVQLNNYVTGDSVPISDWDGGGHNIVVWQVG